MGFSDFGRSITASNRRLQQSIRSKYYRYRSNSLNVSNQDSAEGLSLDKIQRNDRIKRKAHLAKLSFIGCVSLICLIGIFRFFFSTKVPSTNQHNLVLTQIKENAVAKENIKAYNYWVREGTYHINQENYDLAYQEFSKALAIIPGEKRANVGITTCLLMRCKIKHENCDEAHTHYKNLVNSKVLNEEQLSTLAALAD